MKTDSPVVFVVGSANLDTYLSVQNFVKEGETIHAHALREDVGGKGLNQAVASARAGVQTVFIGAIGRDSAGQQVSDCCAAEDFLDTSCLQQLPEVPTGQAMIQLSATGNNAIVIVAGANAELEMEQVNAALANAKPGDVLVCQNEIPKNITLATLRHAKEQGLYTILNLAPASADLDFLTNVDLLIVNETEAAVLLGSTIEDSATKIKQRFGVDVVVTLGEAGAVISTEDFQGQADSLPITVSDTTGAGDAFVGAYAALIADGASHSHATAYGIAAASAACTAPGAQKYHQRRSEFDALAQKVKISPTTQERKSDVNYT